MDNKVIHVDDEVVQEEEIEIEEQEPIILLTPAKKLKPKYMRVTKERRGCK